MSDTTWTDTLKLQKEYKSLQNLLEEQQVDRIDLGRPWADMQNALEAGFRNDLIVLTQSEKGKILELLEICKQRYKEILTKWDEKIEQTQDKILDVQIRAGKLAEECKTAKKERHKNDR
jgi:hypothetical protein